MKLQIYKYIILLVFLFIGTNLPGQEISLVVISHEKGAPNGMTIPELKKVFRGEKQWWDDGTKVVVAFMKTATPSGSATAKKLMGMTGDELNKYWLSLVFQGKAKAPSFFNSEKELVEFVNQNKGAIGIVDQTIPGANRTISIAGKNSF